MDTVDHIRQSVNSVLQLLREHPGQALSQDASAAACIEDGLRCRVDSPLGWHVYTDMPGSIGGCGTSPSPGWLARAALASCEATMIALRAAQLGVELTHLRVTVASRSNDLGMLADNGHIPAGPLDVHVTIEIASPTAPLPELHEIIAWAEHHSPVDDIFHRAITPEVLIKIG